MDNDPTTTPESEDPTAPTGASITPDASETPATPRGSGEETFARFVEVQKSSVEDGLSASKDLVEEPPQAPATVSPEGQIQTEESVATLSQTTEAESVPAEAPNLQETIEKDQKIIAERRARSIRTYLTDMAEALRKKGTSVASLSIAEQKRREEEERTELLRKRKAEQAMTLKKEEEEEQQAFLERQRALREEEQQALLERQQTAAAAKEQEALQQANQVHAQEEEKRAAEEAARQKAEEQKRAIEEAHRAERERAARIAEERRAKEREQEELLRARQKEILEEDQKHGGAKILFEHREVKKPHVVVVAPPPKGAAAWGEQRPKKKSRLVPLATTALVIAAVALLGYAGSLVWNTRAPVAVPEPGGIVPSAENRIVVADGKSREALIAEFEMHTAEVAEIENAIVEISVVKTLPDGTQGPLDSNELMDILAPSVTPAFARSIVGPAFVGIRAGTPNELFMILSIDFYENAFAGMLDFENRVISDLPFLVQSVPGSVILGDGEREQFADLLILNKDTRALIHGSFIRFIYSFPDTRTLVLAPSTETLRRVFGLLVTPRFSR